MENASRFVNAYNKIDTTIRNIYGFKANMTFTDMIRRSVSENYVVRMYEDDLVAFARLRNAIVHRSSDEMTIAEPHTDIVELIEKIARLIATPPKAGKALGTRKVTTIDGDTKIKDAVKLIADTNYSNIPVYENEHLIGVINNKLVVTCIGKILDKGQSVDEFLNSTQVSKIVTESMQGVYYEVASASCTLSDVLNMFQKNRRLLAVILTSDGTKLTLPCGMITPVDILEINNILDNY